MSKSSKWVLALLAAAAVLATAALVIPPKQQEDPVARITLDGELVKEIKLNQVGASFSFTVTGVSGLTNTILVEKGRIRVEAADCPDQVCVDQGFISDGTVPIVCLPNHLVIEIIGGGEAFDAATG